MTNLHITTPPLPSVTTGSRLPSATGVPTGPSRPSGASRPPRARPLRRLGAAVGLTTALWALAATLTWGGCQQRAGMPCKQPSDCTPGLLCNKPPAVGPQGYGICEPGLKGIGERCISSAECSTGLLCSTDVGQPSEDGWHGECQAGSLSDAGATDQGGAADLGPRPG